MAKLNVVKRISKDDFPAKDQPLIDRLSWPINQFMEQVVNAFNKNLTIEDNLPFEVKTFDIEVDSNGIPTTTASFKTTFSKIRGIKVINRVNLTDSTFSEAPFCSWTINNSIITITHVTGLVTAKRYRLTLEITT